MPTPLFSVRAGWRAAAGALFSLQTIGLTALLTAVNSKPTWGASEITEFAVSKIGEIGAASAVSTFVLLEGVGGIMMTYDYMRKTIIEPLIERNEAVREKRREEGRAEGRAQGLAEGEARTLRAASEWYARLEQARREGRDFNEPPPWENRNGKAD